MTESKLQERYDREVSAPHMGHLWNWLKDERYVDMVCSGQMEWEEFKERADQLATRQREILGSAKPPGRTEKLSFDEELLSDSERRQASALEAYLAKRAALLPEVKAFRREKLGGDTLWPEQIVPFLRSEMEGFSGQERSDLNFALERVPSYFDGDETEELVDLVGGYVNRGRGSEHRIREENVRRAVELESMAAAYLPSNAFQYGVMHLIHDKTGRTLEDVARLLTSHYPWTLRDAAWFVLTSATPEVEPLEIRYDGARGMYSLTFAPWISEKTIRSAYHSLYDGDNRRPSNKRLSVFRFVEEHTELGHTPKWTELTKLWNKRNPQDEFEGCTPHSALRRAYKRVEERLASPWME